MIAQTTVICLTSVEMNLDDAAAADAGRTY